ncbi:MAG: DUF2101 family protein [Gammaproteobacteria bacterium]|nr:DUF2101 family protein [Gammaproteobacteria bacterium]
MNFLKNSTLKTGCQILKLPAEGERGKQEGQESRITGHFGSSLSLLTSLVIILLIILNILVLVLNILVLILVYLVILIYIGYVINTHEEVTVRNFNTAAGYLVLIMALTITGGVLAGPYPTPESFSQRADAVCWEKEYQCSTPRPQLA